MVSRREYDIPSLVEIKVFLHRSCISRFPANSCELLKTRPAQAHRLQTIRRESAKHSTRNGDFFAPAGSLVEVTFRQTALVIATTHRTLFGPAQVHKMWWRFQVGCPSSSSPLGNRQTKRRSPVLVPRRQHHPESRFAAHHAFVSFCRLFERIDFIHRSHS
jgi:hypothetical protein